MILVVFLIACSLWETSANEVWFRGCYSQERINKDFVYSAGNYKPSDTSTQDCTSACALISFTYAATDGSYCFCSSTTSRLTKVDDSKCNEVCTGEVCGEPAYIRVFNTNVSIEGLSVHTPDVGFLLQDVELSASVFKGATNASYTFDFGDKTFVLTTCCNTTHKYTRTGVFEVKVSARNSQSGPIRASGWVSIESSLGIVRIKCPEEVVEAGNKTKITAFTTQGTHLKARWITNPEAGVEYFNMSDATMMQVGSKATFGNISGSPQADGAFIKPTSMFNRDGYVMAWEVYAAKTGTIKLQVYRPVCTSSEELFCPLNMTCIPGGVACEPSTTFACPGSGTVYLATGHCLQGGAAQNVSFPASSTPKVDYKLIQEAIVNVSKVGYNIFTLPPHKAIEVHAGDVIGWATNSSAGDLAFEISLTEPQFFYPYSSFSIVVGSTLSKSGGAVKQNINHVIRAHMSQPSYTSKEVIFNKSGVFNVSVIIRSQQGNSLDSLQFCPVYVQVRITNLQIVTPVSYDKDISYATRRPFELKPKINKGSNVAYTWNIANKTLVTNGIGNLQIDEPGLYLVSVMASNNISVCIATTTVSIQNPVGPIKLLNQSQNIEVATSANFTLLFVSGTNFTVHVWFDGLKEETFFIGEAANTTLDVTHTFSTGGTKRMVVKASNNIAGNLGERSAPFLVEVKGKIGDLIMEVKPQLTSDGVLEIATGQEYEISIFSTLNIPINYSLSDGFPPKRERETLKGKVSFLGTFESKNYAGKIFINASANGEVVPLSIPVSVSWCGPPAIFKPASYSEESPLIKTMSTSLELAYRSVYTKRDGCSYGELIYDWRVYKRQNGLYATVENFQPGKREVLEIPPMSLDQGNYTVNVTLTYTGTGHKYLYETFFEIRHSDLFCLISGGNVRGVPYQTAIKLNGNGSVDPDKPEDSGGLSFKWSCKLSDDNNTKHVFSTPYNSDVSAYCSSTSFQDIPIEPYSAAPKLSIEHFRENASYVFQLQISKNGRSKTCQQKISILQEENPSISIRCKSNCKDKVNPQDRLIIYAVCNNCKNDSSALSFKWSLLDQKGELETALIKDPSTTTTGWNTTSIVLRENKLSEKKQYSLKLEVTRRSVTTVTQYYFITTSRPTRGTCQVLPEKGYNIKSKYHIHCKDWYTEDSPILYEFHYISQRQTEAKISSIPQDKTISTLWYYGPFKQTPSSSLPIGNKKDSFRLPIIVKIYNRYGAYNSYNLSAIVRPLSSKQTTAKIEDINKQLTDGSLHSNSKENAHEVLQLITAASSLINNDKKQNTKEKAELRKLMVEKLSQINSDELPMIAEKCNALSLAIENKNEVNSDTQLSATVSLKRSSEILRQKSKVKGYHSNTPLQLEETAQVVFTGISLTFSASEATTKDFLDQVLENLGKTGPKSRDWSVRIRERDGEDSADAAQSVVSKLYGAINQLSGAIQENKVEGEKETLITAKTFGMQLSKTPWSTIGNKRLHVHGENGEAAGSFVLPTGADLLSGGGVGADEIVEIQIVRFPENPVRWDKDLSAFMNSSVIGLELHNGKDKEIPVKNTRKDIEICIPVTGTNAEHYFDTFRSDTLKTFHFRVANNQVKNEPLLVHIKPNKPLTLYLSFYTYPTSKRHNLKMKLPCLNDSLPWPYSKVDNYTILIMDFKTFGENLFLGLEADEVAKSKELETPGNVELVAVSAVVQVNYTVDVRSVGCKYWSEKSQDKWSGEGCRIGNKTSYSSVHCLCNHLTFFGSVVVKPNPIGKPTAAKFVRGYATFVAVCVIFIFYFIALIWARRKDKADLIKVGACPLPDNDPGDQFRYEVTLWTSMRRGAGTNSKVSIILDGEDHDSEARTLEDPERKPFQRGSVDTFLLTTPYILGPLPYIRIWHDNSGGSWFLSRVMVIDLQTDEHYYFICNRWLAVDEDDGQVERLVPLASKEELTEFQHLFVARTRRNLSDNHLWFSVFARPASSRFTRVQRLTCCLCLLMMSMMASAMWYKNQPVIQQDTNNFAGIKFTWQEVFIGVVSSLIVFPVNLIVVQIFRSVRPKPHRVQHRKIPMPPKLSLTVANLSSYNKMKDCSDDSKGSNNSLESMQEKNNSKMRLSINDVHTDVDRISFTSSPLLVDRRQSNALWDASGSTKLQRMVHWFKRHSSIPYYFIYVAWFLAVTMTLGAAVVIILYGIDFGNEKSLKWLFSSTVSFIQDVVITQPIKVLATAIFFALLVKKPDKGEFEVSSDAAQLAEDEDWLYQTGGDQTKAKKRKKTKLLPPDQAKLIAMRNTRMKERKMYSVIREVGFFYLFLCLVMMIAYTHKDYYSFIQTENFKKMFVENFQEINRDLDFWNWTHEELIPNLFPDKWYNNKPIPSNGFASDYNSQMVGGARLRHIRVKPGVCEVPATITFITRDCFGQYSMSDEDHSDYIDSWKNVTTYSKPVSRKDVNWRYQTWDKLDGYPVWAELNTYSGGGYVHVLEPGMKNDEKLKKLEKEFWIDRHSRAIVTEFTIYNAQTNLFTIATLVAEFPASGGVIPFVTIQTARLYNYTKDYMFFVLACEGLFVLYILFFLYQVLRKLYKEGSAYFKEFWNIVDLVIVVSAGTGIGLYIYRLLQYTNVLEKSRNAPFQFKSFQFAGYWDEMYTFTIAILVTFSTIKLNKLLRFNKRMSLMSSTLKNAAFSLMMFGLIFGILFLAFTLIGTVVFGTAVRGYRKSGSAFTSLLSLMLGKTSFLEMNEANRVLGPLYFFCFMFLVSMVLINMFLSIIIDSYHEVKRDLDKQNNEYEIVDFIIERFKLWSGIGKADKPEFKHRHVRWDVVESKVKSLNALTGGGVDHISKLESRIEKLIERTDLLFAEIFPERRRRPTKAMRHKLYKEHRL